jgi:hypothetical protein
MPANILARLARCGRLLGTGAVLWSSACSEHPLREAGHGGPIYDPPHPVGFFESRNVDILFVIDNSASMAEEQHALSAAFGTLVDMLDEASVGYRIGFTTTDNGNPWCSGTSPEAGALQLRSCRSRPEEFEPLEGEPTQPLIHACNELCPEALTDIEVQPTAGMDDDDLRPRPWIESSNGLTNLPEEVSTTQALQCFAPQGIVGCGFESPLEAMWKALRRSQDQNEPGFGFIRPSAVLSVVHLTDEMDCSYNSDWESIFLPDGGRVFWSDPDAASPTSAVCWNAGVACEGESPYDDCRAVDLDVEGNEVAEDAADDLAVLRPVSRYVDILQDLEENKQSIIPEQQVLVSVIGGVRPDGVTYQDALDPAFQADFGIGPGCEGAGGSALPPARLRELAEAFQVGDDRNMFSICRDDYSPALAAIAEGILEQFPPSCLPACVADTDPSTEVLEPSCTFAQETPDANGSISSTEMPECGPGDEVPEGHDMCFVMLVGDARGELCTDYGFNLELRFVRRVGVSLPGGTAIVGNCELSDDRRTDCPELP